MAVQWVAGTDPAIPFVHLFRGLLYLHDLFTGTGMIAAASLARATLL